VKRALLIANSHAGGVREDTKDVVATAFAGGNLQLDLVSTSARGDATRLARAAVAADVDAVIALGGDGTVNEVAQSLVHSDVALGIIPVGTTNVMARAIRMPLGVSEASAFLASRLESGSKRRVNVGRFGDRYFLFGAGMGLDAEVVRRVEADSEKKEKHQHLFFVQQAVIAAARSRGAKPAITMRVDGGTPEKVVLVLCANAGPFTYFREHPVDVFPEVQLHGGLDAFGLNRIGLGTIPRLAWAFFVSGSHIRWNASRYHHDISLLELRADVPLPVQVDGDYIGEWDEADVSLVPLALDLLL
jgi:diacylglycerol kinase family enzyme